MRRKRKQSEVEDLCVYVKVYVKNEQWGWMRRKRKER